MGDAGSGFHETRVEEGGWKTSLRSTHRGEPLLTLLVALPPHVRGHGDRGARVLGEDQLLVGERLVDNHPALQVVLVVEVDHTILLGEVSFHRTIRLPDDDGEEVVGAGHHLGARLDDAVQRKVVRVVQLLAESDGGELGGRSDRQVLTTSLHGTARAEYCGPGIRR